MVCFKGWAGERGIVNIEKHPFSDNVLPFTAINRGFRTSDETNDELCRRKLILTPTHPFKDLN